MPGKWLEIDALVSEILSDSRRKIIIWSAYVASIERLVARYADHGSVALYGGVDVAERQDLAHRFQEDRETRILVANAAAAGTGFTLTAACHSIYESLSWRYDFYAQSQDRTFKRYLSARGMLACVTLVHVATGCSRSEPRLTASARSQQPTLPAALPIVAMRLTIRSDTGTDVAAMTLAQDGTVSWLGRPRARIVENRVLCPSGVELLHVDADGAVRGRDIVARITAGGEVSVATRTRDATFTFTTADDGSSRTNGTAPLPPTRWEGYAVAARATASLLSMLLASHTFDGCHAESDGDARPTQ